MKAFDARVRTRHGHVGALRGGTLYSFVLMGEFVPLLNLRGPHLFPICEAQIRLFSSLPLPQSLRYAASLENDLERGVEREVKRLVWNFTTDYEPLKGVEPVHTPMNIDQNDAPKVQKYRSNRKSGFTFGWIC